MLDDGGAHHWLTFVRRPSSERKGKVSLRGRTEKGHVRPLTSTTAPWPYLCHPWPASSLPSAGCVISDAGLAGRPSRSETPPHFLGGDAATCRAAGSRALDDRQEVRVRRQGQRLHVCSINRHQDGHRPSPPGHDHGLGARLGSVFRQGADSVCHFDSLHSSSIPAGVRSEAPTGPPGSVSWTCDCASPPSASQASYSSTFRSGRSISSRLGGRRGAQMNVSSVRPMTARSLHAVRRSRYATWPRSLYGTSTSV